MSIFCPELQKLLKPIYELTKKGRPFVWGDEQQRAFDKGKNRLLNLPVLSMLEKKGRFCYTQIPANMPQAVLYTKYRMESLSL